MLTQDGAQVETDPAYISVVPADGVKRTIQARPLHAARCAEYEREGQRLRLVAERKAWDAQQRRKLKKAPAGRREPGQ